MAEVIHHYTDDTDRATGSGAALGIVLGVLLVLALLVGGYWLFFRAPAATPTAPSTTIIEQPEQAPAPQTDIDINGGTTAPQGGSGDATTAP